MVCVSVAPKNMKEARFQLLDAGKLADVVEIRIESIADLNIRELLKQPRPEVIITNRPGEKTLEKERLAHLYEAIEAGAEYIDVEVNSGTKTIAFLKNASYLKKSQIILSCHNYLKTPGYSSAILERMKGFYTSIIKIVTYAKGIEDNAKIFRLLKLAKKKSLRVSAFCMGEKGEMSRILSPYFNSYITYCSLDQGQETADGQMPISKLLETYHYKSLNENTKIFGLVGNPVAHSRGIYVHNEFFKINKLNAVYVNFLVDDFGKFFRVFSKYIQGISITIPHKETAAKFIKKLSSEAIATKSVNTIIKTTNRFTGYNTDALAAIKILKQKLKNKSVAVLGTGGTARSAIYAAKSTGATVTVFGRNLKKAKRLSREFDCGFSSIEEMGKIKKMDVIINTTPVGMQPDINSSLIPKEILKRKMLVVDFVYTPPITKLLKDARNCGCEIISGAKIFEEQAKLQQQLFKSVI